MASQGSETRHWRKRVFECVRPAIWKRGDSFRARLLCRVDRRRCCPAFLLGDVDWTSRLLEETDGSALASASLHDMIQPATGFLMPARSRFVPPSIQDHMAPESDPWSIQIHNIIQSTRQHQRTVEMEISSSTIPLFVTSGNKSSMNSRDSSSLFPE